MARLETIFCATTWALMNVLLIGMAYETTGSAQITGTPAIHVAGAEAA